MSTTVITESDDQVIVVKTDTPAYTPEPSDIALLQGQIDTLTSDLADTNSDVAATNTALTALEASFAYTGQCKLIFVSATQIKLTPFNGNKLIINGVIQAIPAAGVTVSNAGLAANTRYYVYAYMNAGVMTLELSTTTHATGDDGIEIKSGDVTRSLVGMIWSNASSIFVDQANTRWVRGWFNDPGIAAHQISTTAVATSSTSAIELESAVRVYVLMWDREWFQQTVKASVQNNVAGAISYISCGISAGTYGTWSWFNAPLANYVFQLDAFYSAQCVGDQSVIFGLWATVGSGTGTYYYKTNSLVTGRR